MGRTGRASGGMQRLKVAAQSGKECLSGAKTAFMRPSNGRCRMNRECPDRFLTASLTASGNKNIEKR